MLVVSCVVVLFFFSFWHFNGVLKNFYRHIRQKNILLNRGVGTKKSLCATTAGFTSPLHGSSSQTCPIPSQSLLLTPQNHSVLTVWLT